MGNGCTGNKTPSCGEAPGLTPLLHTSSGQRLRLLWGHAMVSDEDFHGIVAACPTAIAVVPDCMVLTEAPDCGAGRAARDRLRLNDMSPGGCAVWNDTHWAYMVNNTADPHYECCTAMNTYQDKIGEVCIYNIMGETGAPRPPGSADAGAQQGC